MELSELLDCYNCNIICITETWCKDDTLLTAFDDKFQVFMQNRTVGIGGGVLLAVRNNIGCKLIHKDTIGGCEILIVDIKYSGTNYVRYVAAYRPPDTNVENSVELFNVIHENLQNVNLFMILGDFNLPDISWNEFTTGSRISEEFLTTCLRLGAHQCVNFPTRGENMLDLILCSHRGLINSICSKPPFANSDHVTVLCHIAPFQKLSVNNQAKPCFRKADYGLINAFLSTLDWSEIYQECNSTNDYWMAFKNILNTIVYNFVPYETAKDKKNVPWFNEKLKRLRATKQRRWRKYIQSKNIVTHCEYKQSANEFRKEFLSAKCSYEKKLFADSSDLNKFYGYIKSQTKVKSAIPSLRRSDGSMAISDQDKAEEFSSYFASVFVQDNGVLPEFDFNPKHTVNNFTCSVRELIKIVLKLKSNSSPGPDGFTPKFVKNVLANIADPLYKVYRKSLAEGQVPDDWKSAHIIPIFKKGDAQLTSQYRPVSLTSIFCKILERIVRPQMLDFMYKNKLIPKDQHGFIPKKSTVTNLLECMDAWTLNMDKGLSTDVIYLDYSKCFDTVCHNKLLLKLSKYGVTGTAHTWLKNFLTDRVQFVKINNTLSTGVGVVSGVPQGTVLGPLLFILYSADLPNVISHSKISMYADDTKVFKTIGSNDDRSSLQEDLDHIFEWANKWQMILNPEKTKNLTIGSAAHTYYLNGNVIDKVDSIKDVGVIIQSDLKFSKHCSSVVKKSYFIIRNIFSTFRNHDTDFYVNMYKKYVRPVIEHSSQVWSPALKFNIDKIERVQQYFTRRLLYNSNLPYSNRLLVCKLDTLEERRLRSDLTLFYKMLSKVTLIDMNNSFSFYNRRRGHSKNLFKYYCRTEKRKMFWINRIVNNWNELNDSIVTSNSVNTFKRKINLCQFPGRGSYYC